MHAKSIAIIVGTLFLLTGLIAGLLWVNFGGKEEALVPGPTPTVTLAPTRPQTPLQAAVATLSAAIASYTPEDTTLAPPYLVLPLGF